MGREGGGCSACYECKSRWILERRRLHMTRSESGSSRIPVLFIAGNAGFTYIDMCHASVAGRQIAFYEPGKCQEVT